MLPEIRKDEYLYPIPKFDICEGDVKNFFNELKGFHEIFHDCFHRSESREHFFRYMAGQFSDLERKSIEPIALAVEDGNVRAMQRFISDTEWNDANIMAKYRNLINEDMGTPDGVLIFDESGFVKKGNESIGVARQYCGNVGKVENSQVGVFAAYASPKGYGLIDKRLFIPELWFKDDHKQGRKKCKLPESVSFKTKPQLASEMLNELAEEAIVPFKYVTADSLYGNSDDFIEAVEQHPDLTYFVEVPCNTQCWFNRPITVEKTYKYKGEQRTKIVVEKSSKKPVDVKTIAKNINDFFWYRRKVSEGTKGPIEYEFTKRRVVLSKGNTPTKSVWLIMRRTLGKSPDYKFFLSNAGVSARLKLFVWLSGIRWAIEQCFEETKTELGMDHYEVRKYPGWNHHIITCMLAHFFLWHLKIRMGKKSSIYYSVAA